MASSHLMQAKVSAKGWVVIPAPLRRRFGLKPGALVDFEEADGRILISLRTQDPVDEFFGKLAGRPSLTDALLKSRTEELNREEDRLRSG